MRTGEERRNKRKEISPPSKMRKANKNIKKGRSRRNKGRKKTKN